MNLISVFELNNVRPEIRELFKDRENGTWRTGFPVELETMLLLRELNCNILSLLEILHIGDNNPKASGKSEDNIEPKNPV